MVVILDDWQTFWIFPILFDLLKHSLNTKVTWPNRRWISSIFIILWRGMHIWNCVCHAATICKRHFPDSFLSTKNFICIRNFACRWLLWPTTVSLKAFTWLSAKLCRNQQYIPYRDVQYVSIEGRHNKTPRVELKAQRSMAGTKSKRSTKSQNARDNSDEYRKRAFTHFGSSSWNSARTCSEVWRRCSSASLKDSKQLHGTLY